MSDENPEIDYSYYYNKIALARLHDLQLRCGLPLTKEEDYKPYSPKNEMRYNPYHDPKTGRFTSGKSLDNSGEYDIIKSRSGDVSAEYQRYGRNKETLINNTYIESGEYRRKFDRLTDNAEVNKTLYACAKEALKHRSGTELEDMYWIDGKSGKVVAKALNESVPHSVSYSESINTAIQKKSCIIPIHTHPQSMPPSVTDFNSACEHGYVLGVIACHDGKIFGYTSHEKISERIYSMYIEKGIKAGFSEYGAQIFALNKLKENHNIDFWEVK